MNQNDLFREYLQIADSFPLSVPFHILEIPAGILIADGRESATAATLESVAAMFGHVIRIESIPSKWTERGWIIGCLIRPTCDVATASDGLRAAYVQAMAKC
ncbi:hypothetical protein [Rhodopirellula baltica]